MFWLLYCLPLLFKVSRRGGSCCGCYIVYHYCLRFDRGEVHVVVGHCLSLLFKILQRGGLSFGCNIVNHYCLRFDRGEVHVVVVILYIIIV